MSQLYDKIAKEKRLALGALSYETLLVALENEEEEVMQAVHERVLLYTNRAIEALQAGEDYLGILVPDDALGNVDRLALDLVLEAFEDEFAATMADDEG